MGEGTRKGKITHRYTWRKRHTERNRDIEKQTHRDRTAETDKKVRKELVGKQGFNVRGRNMSKDDGAENDQNSIYT